MVKNKRGPGLNLDRPPARQPLPGDARTKIDPVVKFMAKAKAKAAATERRKAVVRHRMRGKQEHQWVHVTRDRFGMEMYHPPGELPPSMLKRAK
eukprot:1947258-Amphidinium_carterae.1